MGLFPDLMVLWHRNNVPGFVANVTFSKIKLIIGIRGCQTVSSKSFFSCILLWIEQKQIVLLLPSLPFLLSTLREGSWGHKPGSDIINVWFHIFIKCITLIKSIKEASKRETREKWGYSLIRVLNNGQHQRVMMFTDVWNPQGRSKFNFISGELNICLVMMFFYHFQGWGDLESI